MFPLPLIENRELVDNILSLFGNEIKMQMFAVAASLYRGGTHASTGWSARN
jgi:hypothetical protein